MATKYYCDGCDREIKDHGGKSEFRVLVESDSASKVHGNFDLCKKCADILCGYANPRSWARTAEPAR